MSMKALLLGLDGATFSLLDPLMSQGLLPSLKGLIDSGVRAELRSIIPPLTPPAWTSMLTGRSPSHHGILDFFQPHSPGSKQIRLATTADVRAETIGAMANREGMRTTLLNFPATFPPPKLDGYVVSGWMPWRQLRLGCHPEGLFDRLKTIPGFNPRELAMDMALEAKATEESDEKEYLDWVDLHARRDQHWLDVLRFLVQEDPCEMTAILLDGPDKIQHLCWRFLDPGLWPTEPTAQEEEVRAGCLDYFRHLDRVIAEIVALAGSEATVVIASDHGFGATGEVFHLNTWLEQAGYLAWADGVSLNGGIPGILGLNHLSQHIQWIDWEHTTAYASSPTSNGIHIVKADQHEGKGVTPEDIEYFRSELIERLHRFTDPESGEHVISRVWLKEEIFPGPAGALAPDLTLTLRDGGLVSILPSSKPLRKRPNTAGTHQPEGVFIARGPGIRKGITIPELSILDVAPLLLYSMDMAVPEDLEGRVPLELFEPSLRARRPVRIVPSSDVDSPPKTTSSVEVAYDEEAEAVVMARLRELGYIE